MINLDIKTAAINKLDSYNRGFNNKTLTQLDVLQNNIETKTIDKLAFEADRQVDKYTTKAFETVNKNVDKGLNFILTEFGLQNVDAKVYKPTPLNAATVAVGNDFSFEDKGNTTMHIDGGEPPLSILGTPVFCDMKLSFNKKVETSFNTEVQKTEVHLLNVLAEVNMQKDIVKTKVQGVDGTVKTYISDGDWQVTLRGFFYNTFKKDYPKKQVENFTKLVKVKKELDVVSEFLLLFGIKSLVVESVNMPQEAGKQNQQKFEITCVSDTPLFLRKINNTN
jgi:Domain of unknown function (DUF6046)